MLEIDQYGTGPPLVLIHGSPANGKTWKAVGEHLSDRFRVIAPTLPGHGTEGGDVAAMATADMAAAVEPVIAGHDRPIRLAAHSFGANVALNIALRGRVAIDRLILFEPVNVMALALAGEDAAFDAAKSAFDGYVERYRRGEVRAVAAMIEIWFGRGALDAMPAPVQDYLIERTEVNVRDVGAIFGERYTRAMLQDLRLPVVIVRGGASPPIMTTIIDALARLLGNASIEVIDGATHGMLISHPDRVAGVIGRDSVRGP